MDSGAGRTLGCFHCWSVRCWCASINLLSGTAASLSQLYNRKGITQCWLWSFCIGTAGCIWAVLRLTAGRT